MPIFFCLGIWETLKQNWVKQLLSTLNVEPNFAPGFPKFPKRNHFSPGICETPAQIWIQQLFTRTNIDPRFTPGFAEFPGKNILFEKLGKPRSKTGIKCNSNLLRVISRIQNRDSVLRRQGQIDEVRRRLNYISGGRQSN